MRWSLPRVGLLALLVGAALGLPPAWLHITIPGRTVHNSHYLAASFLYQLQTMLGADSNPPNVMYGKIQGTAARHHQAFIAARGGRGARHAQQDFFGHLLQACGNVRVALLLFPCIRGASLTEQAQKP